MKLIISPFAAASIIALSVFTSSVQAADAAKGKEKAASCSACHGMNGISAVPAYPNLAGQKAAYLASAMNAYKNGNRSGGNAPMMKAMVTSLSDADIADVAAYFSSLK